MYYLCMYIWNIISEHLILLNIIIFLWFAVERCNSIAIGCLLSLNSQRKAFEFCLFEVIAILNSEDQPLPRSCAWIWLRGSHKSNALVIANSRNYSSNKSITQKESIWKRDERGEHEWGGKGNAYSIDDLLSEIKSITNSSLNQSGLKSQSNKREM